MWRGGGVHTWERPVAPSRWAGHASEQVILPPPILASGRGTHQAGKGTENGSQEQPAPGL